MTQSKITRALNTVFDGQSQHINTLLSLLEKENEDLKAAISANLEHYRNEKQHCIIELEKSGQALKRLFKEAGIHNTPNAIEQLMHISSDQQELNKKWSTIEAKLVKSRELNLLNGSLINLHTNAAQRAFSSLSGRTMQNSAYGSDGSRPQDTSKRAIAKA